MNQKQREYLIKKIENNAYSQRKSLEAEIPERPSLNNYLLRDIMSGKFKIKSNEDLKKTISERALNMTDQDDFIYTKTKHWGKGIEKQEFTFLVEELFVIPQDYKIKLEEYENQKNSIEEKIRLISIKEESLVTRINLSTNKRLDSLIEEIDDMGDLSLFDTTLKQLTE